MKSEILEVFVYLTSKGKLVKINLIWQCKRWVRCCSENFVLTSAPHKFIPRNIVRSLFGKLIYKAERPRQRTDCLWFLYPFIRSTIDYWLFRPQTMFCLWPFVMLVYKWLCKGHTWCSVPSDCRQSSFLWGSFSCVMTAKIMYLQAYKK